MIAKLANPLSSKRLVGFVVLAVLALAIPAFSQSAASRGSISGTVTDPHGDVIPGAKVTIRNADLAAERVVTTNDEGRFVSTLLPSGPYLIQVAAPGFTLKKPVRVTLGVGSSVAAKRHDGDSRDLAKRDGDRTRSHG